MQHPSRRYSAWQGSGVFQPNRARRASDKEPLGQTGENADRRLGSPSWPMSWGWSGSRSRIELRLPFHASVTRQGRLELKTSVAPSFASELAQLRWCSLKHIRRKPQNFAYLRQIYSGKFPRLVGRG